MGASTSTLTSEEVAELQEISPFSARDIKDLYARFTKLDRANSGWISAADFQLIPELSMNPLCERIIALFQFDQEQPERVNFRTFVRILAVFHPKASADEKLKLAFRCYDVDADGFLNEADLTHVLKLVIGDNMTDEQIAFIALQTLSNAGADHPGLSFEQFSKALDKSDVLGSLSIDLSQIMSQK